MLTVLLVVVWVGSAWWRVSFSNSSGDRLCLQSGRVFVADDPVVDSLIPGEIADLENYIATEAQTEAVLRASRRGLVHQKQSK